MAGPGILCPACGCNDTQVVNTRPSAGRIWRRRQCRWCGRTWSTVEHLRQPEPPAVLPLVIEIPPDSSTPSTPSSPPPTPPAPAAKKRSRAKKSATNSTLRKK